MSEEIEAKIETIKHKSEETLRKITSGLEKVGRELEERDIPRLTRNIVVLATGAMTMYTMATAVSAMLPSATAVFAQLGYILGYMIPLMVNIMMLSTMISLIKVMLR